MAEVPLRSYLHEIEKHIESGRMDQAIAHSRYILQTYPKYVDAYRLLGKAYLENHRYSDASDIFQRVLSSVPEDFISQVGMSIIREDEGNLDEAIWHMERAFESQPSNAAIQDELKRLFVKRDNIEPPKIRLTRGALARLYAKGELYQQAIGEIRAVLSENPDRLDLHALLAEIYFKSNSLVEAAETAIELLRHLPNCIIANRIMVQVLSGTSREMEAKTYQQRLSQLDPYSAFAPSDEPNSDNVPDQSVRIEKLEWKPEQASPKADQPAWASSLGVELGEMGSSDEESLPDWLKGLSEDADGEEPFPPPPPSAFAFGEADKSLLTDMEETPTRTDSGSDDEISGSLDEKDVIPPFNMGDKQEGRGETEIPDWLQSMVSAKQVEDIAEPGEELTPDQELFDSSYQDTEIGASMEGQGEAAPGELPDWLSNLQRSNSVPESEHGEKTEEAEPSEQLPDWLIENAQQTEAGANYDIAQKSFPDEPEAQAGELPDWLVSEQTSNEGEPETELGESGEETEAEVEIPDWLKAIEADESETDPEISQTFLEESEWMLDESARVEGEESITTETGSSEESLDLPEWLMETDLEKDTSRVAAPDEEIFDADIPKWILQTDESAVLEEPIEVEEPILGDTQPTQINQTEEPAPDTFITDESKLEPETDTIEESKTESIESDEMDEAFAWLQSLESEEKHEEAGESFGAGLAVMGGAAFIKNEISKSQEEEIDESDKDSSIEQSTQDALVQDELETSIESDSSTAVPEAQNEFDGESLGLDKGLADQEAAFAWLESLAVSQSSEEDLTQKPEESPETIQEWINQEAEFSNEGAPETQYDLEETEAKPSESDSYAEVSDRPAQEPGETQETAPADEIEDFEAGEEDAAIEIVEEIQKQTEPIESEPQTIAEDLEHEGQIAEEETGEASTDIERAEEAAGEPMLQQVDLDASSTDEMTAEDASAAPILSDEAAASEAKEAEIPSPDFSPARLDLNEASLVELEQIPNIGFVLAQRITDYRDENGPFRAVEDLQDVPGIGAVNFEMIRNFLLVKTKELDEKQSDTILEIPEGEKVSGELSEARKNLSDGKLTQSMEQYARLIGSNQDLNQILRDLEVASVHFPDKISVWQNLGDVHLRLNQVTEALQAYIKAQQLLH